MSKCPFWSSEKKKVECNTECPMNDFFSIKDNCPFKEYLEESEINFKSIDEENYSYEQIVRNNIEQIKK